MARTYDKTNPKRDEIIEIASRLFYEQGFGATGIKQIIDEAGIAKGTFYSHFPSKEALGLAWLDARHAQWSGWFEEALRPKKTSGEKLLASFTFLEKWLKDCSYRGCAFLNTMAETPNPGAPMRKEVAVHKQELHVRFQELAEDHFKAIGFSTKEAQQQGSLFFLLFEGALIEAQNFHATWPVRTARKAVERMLYPEKNA